MNLAHGRPDLFLASYASEPLAYNQTNYAASNLANVFYGYQGQNYRPGGVVPQPLPS
jgi:hypothetical protein